MKNKRHISKVTFLSVIGAPQVVEYEGRVYDFDGKIGVFPCTEECFTKRQSKKGPKGARSVRSVNVDSEFYYNLFCRAGGVYDAIDRICPCLKGTQYRIQQDGARPHTSEGEIEDLEAGCNGDGWSCIFVTQPANHTFTYKNQKNTN